MNLNIPAKYIRISLLLSVVISLTIHFSLMAEFFLKGRPGHHEDELSFAFVAFEFLTSVLLAFVIALVILILGFFVFGVPVRGSLVLLLGYTIVYILLSLSLGIFISSVVDSQQVAMLISMVALMLPTILLSGFIFPIENMPWPLQWLSHIIPAKWFIIVMRGVMLKGIGVAVLWKETLILFGMIAFFIALSVRKFKIRLD
jgi:ABC-2 type transport system permease protein